MTAGRYHVVGTQGIHYMIAPEGHEFPTGRTARCCEKKVRSGDSVLIIPVKSGSLIVQVVFHREHLLDLVEPMPLGRNEAQAVFDRLKGRIKETGKAFPD